jgi:hypothetical protein
MLTGRERLPGATPVPVDDDEVAFECALEGVGEKDGGRGQRPGASAEDTFLVLLS